MERWLSSDAAVRVLSVLVALLIWVYVTAQGSPTVTQTLRGVPVQWVNVPPGLAVTAVEPAEVDVRVRGPARLVSDLDGSRVQATVNLRGEAAGPAPHAVHVRTPSGVQVVGVDPPQVVVHLERLAEREVPVAVEVAGRPAPGMRLGEARADPPVLRVRGAARAVAAVSRAVAGVDVEGAGRNVEVRVPVYAVDADGRPVLGVTLVPDQVAVRVPVARREPLRLVPIAVPLEGTPAEGAAVLAVHAEPAAALVRAPDEVAERLGPVRTQPVSVQGAAETLEVEVPVEPPPGVEFLGPERVRVTVVIRRGP